MCLRHTMSINWSITVLLQKADPLVQSRRDQGRGQGQHWSSTTWEATTSLCSAANHEHGLEAGTRQVYCPGRTNA